ncbi:MAG: glycoside hydrolase family 73 protein [Candidatus Methylacidiphilales bacterium]
MNFTQRFGRGRKHPIDVGRILFLRPFRPVTIKKCWREPQEPFRILTFFSACFMSMGVVLGFMTSILWDNLRKSDQVLKLSFEERQQLEQDLHRIRAIHEESTRTVWAVAGEVQAVLETTSGKRRAFLYQLIPCALEHQAESQIPASALISMAIYESNYGSSDLAQQHHNYFGIKAWQTTWSGEKIRMVTRDLGRKTMADFRVYPDFKSGVDGYVKFLRGSRRYQQAFEYGDGTLFVRELLKGGYCPDKDYLERIKGIMSRHQLHRLDLQHLMPALARVPDLETHTRKNNL